MHRRNLSALLVAAGAALAQELTYPFVCPMDPDVRSPHPAKCPRCGMALVAGIPDSREFGIDLTTAPRVLRPGVPLIMRLVVRDPESGTPAKLQLFHEKLFHLFIVSEDWAYFAHEHPDLQPDGSFRLRTALPAPGHYRVLSDVYPEGAKPQMIARSVFVPGRATANTSKVADVGPKRAANLTVSLRTQPEQPMAGKLTMLFFKLEPRLGLEQYLGAWGHMLAASSDLVDLIHAHPAWEEAGEEVQFNVIFPRPGVYRVWVQLQRLGAVNTVAFNVPVAAV